MYKVEIIDPCGCAKKRKAWQKNLTFDTKDEALNVAQKMITQGNEKFCKRHNFELNENGNTIEIVTTPNK